ncbi:MAG: hypothetical protein JXM71_08350 [Spirochaetales bacterium]|nr:hypothetical protein [Spirochaetales bacterium]
MKESLMEPDDSALRIVAGILADADAEVARIVAEAGAYAASVTARAGEQGKTLEREASARAEAAAASIIADAEAKAVIERRKSALALQERMARDMVARAARDVAAMIGQPGYRDVLKGWLVEGAVGLSADEATVRASKDELPMLDRALLDEVEAAVLAATGKATKLRVLAGDPLTGQGVYLEAADGRLAYDNRVATRFERQRSAIRKLIYQALSDSRTA